MDYAATMRVIEGAGNLRRHRCGEYGWDRAVTYKTVGQGAAAQERHQEIDDIVILAEIHDRTDVRVDQMSCGFGFPTKALAHLGLTSEMRVEDLDDQRPPELNVLGVIDMCHAARAEPMNDAVAVPRQTPQRTNLGIRGLRRSTGDLRQRRRAARALNGDSAVPRAAVRA